MRFKKKHWVLLALGITLFILIAMLVITLAVKINWWWFLGLLIFFSFGWGIFGIVELITLALKKPKIEKVELDDAVKLAKDHSLNHPDNPDNFLLIKHHPVKVGESGAEKTPMIVLEGEGSERNEERYFIINKEDKSEFAMLVNPTEQEIKEKIIQIAKSQPRPVITESISGTDEFGRPTTRYVTKTTSASEVKKQEEIKKAEEDKAI